MRHAASRRIASGVAPFSAEPPMTYELLTFQVTDPTQCTTAGGVQTAGISGAVAVGNPTGQ